jgi:hypothetical protein
VDADCPVDPTVRLDVWLEHTLSKIPFKKERIEHFLDRAKEVPSRRGLAWENVQSKPLGQTEMRKRLRTLYKEDQTFRDSVDGSVRDDPEVRERYTQEIKGACARGVCNTNTQPATGIFDGRAEVTFHEADDGLKAARSGRLHNVTAVSCDTPDAPFLCRHWHNVPLVEGAQPVLKNTPVKDYYRVNFTDSAGTRRYLVNNSVTASGLDAKRKCAAELCALNERECPHPHCTRDGTRCIPTAEWVDHVTLR